MNDPTADVLKHAAMVTSTATASRPHSQSQSQRQPARSTTTPSNPPRIAASVGQALPPLNPYLQSLGGQQTHVRTPSPNYFGLIVDPASDPRDSGVGPKDNWSPPTSSIRSFGGPSPNLPLDANPDFEAFRRQTEKEKNNFSLSHGSLQYFSSTPSAQPRPQPERRPVRPVRTETQDHPSPKSNPQRRDGAPEQMELDSGRQVRNKALDAPSFFDLPRQQSPIHMNELNAPIQRNAPSSLDDRHPRLSLPQNKVDPPSPHLHNLKVRNQHPRADTLPSTLEDWPAMISVGQLKDILGRVQTTQYLLLDLRVFPQFSQSRIQGALNLCIPTTLLKRPTFNLQKLQDTFTQEEDKARFCQWKTAKHLVVYDAFSSEKKDAISAINTLKKFSLEGWRGNAYILRGGFAEFQKQFPKLIDSVAHVADSQGSRVNLSLGASGPGVAPVAGGCLMPATKNAANPFFSNIRQNQDLVDGVGQMDIKIPEEMETIPQNILPNWLIRAADKDDHGKRVSDKFLRLELAEKDRMNKALSAGVSYGSQAHNAKDVQLAGIEKGSKNRYNNIWPFEHARVKLQGRYASACDYINASHVKASRSNKHYIASQGPLPATFEDFWSVIWDHDIRVIVMLTAESEGGQLKCHPYWASKEFGPMKLKALSEKKVSLDTKRHCSLNARRDSGRRRAMTTADSALPSPQAETPHAVIRKFTLSHAAHPFSPIREITQIHYSSWPDFGAPASPAQLLGLVELTNMMQRATTAPIRSTLSDEPEAEEATRPMLVHCSAGCGRTGTFCTIDSVIDMLKRQRKEHKSGVTPMEVSSEDYMSKGKEGKEGKEGTVSGQWVFDQDVDLVEKTVEDFRGQRLSMVQSLRQYVLCYETVFEWIAQQQSGLGKPGRDRSGSDTGLERSPS